MTRLHPCIMSTCIGKYVPCLFEPARETKIIVGTWLRPVNLSLLFQENIVLRARVSRFEVRGFGARWKIFHRQIFFKTIAVDCSSPSDQKLELHRG